MKQRSWVCWACYYDDFGENVSPYAVGYFDPRSLDERCSCCGAGPTLQDQFKLHLLARRDAIEELLREPEDTPEGMLTLATFAGMKVAGELSRDAVPPMKRKQQRKSTSHLLSMREAARRFGIDRNTTLREMIDAGHIRAVPFRGGLRIPASEVDRVCAEGLTPLRRPQRQRITPPPIRTPRVRRSEGESIGEKIRGLKI
ncbi:helix-turn-helix domain-containing protein [Melittangium boletus]|uniref:helix-turn-helix domain-containing protein n=1 Tax=Melittangium boletus TaxID=83453 RepID=UPI000BB3C80E|nr:helix-turn-helix domain-containing protein [Melittangium boletus]